MKDTPMTKAIINTAKYLLRFIIVSFIKYVVRYPP
jgi:hypothetical protein